MVCEAGVGLSAERLQELWSLAAIQLIAEAQARLEWKVASGKRDARSLAVIPLSMIEGAELRSNPDAFGGASEW